MFQKNIINRVKPLSKVKFINTTKTFNPLTITNICKMSTKIKAESVTVTTPNGHTYQQPTGLFINNEFWKASNPDKKLKVEDPSTGKHVLDIESCTAEDVKYAIDVAHDTFHKQGDKWAELDPRERSEFLYKIGDYIEKNLDLLASIECMDNGKAYNLAKGDVAVAAKYFKSANQYNMDGRFIETGDGYVNYTVKEPLGVVGAIIPWNFPFLIMTWKLVPTLFAGNTIIVKPASSTCLTALMFGKICQEVGIPAGVVSVIPGPGSVVGDILADSMKLDKISFTGSTGIGKAVATKATQSNLKHVTMELGGKSGHILFGDADLKKAIPNIVNGIFKNAGQICSSGSRLYVQSSVYDQFLKEFKEYIETQIKIGSPFDPENYQGSIQNKTQYQTVLDYIKLGKEEGATVLTGGEAIGDGSNGYYIKPTVFIDTKEDMKIVKEEIFGPVLTVGKFDTVEEAIKLVNDSEFGLGAGIETTNLATALHVAKKIKSGIVWVNEYNDFDVSVPFGGYKQSGYGKEMGTEALAGYVNTKAVRIKL